MYKRNILRICSLVSAIIIIFDCAYLQAAQDNQSVNFSVRAVQSNRQNDKRKTYFDLLLSPGETHTLEVDIFNNADSPMTASVTACTAGTNSGGVIDYDNPDAADDSLKIPFKDIATVENPIINIPADGSNRIKINIEMPDEAFDGVMLGGIVVKKTEDEAVEIEGTSIQNEYCYIIGVQIQVNDNEAEPDFRLRRIEPTQSNYRTAIAANLQNYQAAIAKGLEIDANIYYKNNPQPLYSNSDNDFDVAPNSNFDYIIPCYNKLSPGDYRLRLTARLEDRIWEFDEAFTISPLDAGNINNSSIIPRQASFNRIITICLLIILIIIIIIAIMTIKRDRNKFRK